MIEKRNIEAFLRINGIPATAKDEEIRSVLISARWNKNEVDTALMVLKENVKNQTTHVDTLHKVFNSDNRLTSAEITSLLGIDVDITSSDVGNLAEQRIKSQKLQSVLIFVLSIAIAVGSLGYLMYKEKVGYFNDGSHTTVKHK